MKAINFVEANVVVYDTTAIHIRNMEESAISEGRYNWFRISISIR